MDYVMPDNTVWGQKEIEKVHLDIKDVLKKYGVTYSTAEILLQQLIENLIKESKNSII